MRRRTLALATILSLLATMTVGCTSDSGPEATARRLAEGLPHGDVEGMAFVDSNAQPTSAGAAYAQAKQLAGELELGDLTLTVSGQAAVAGNVANVPATADWKVRGKVWHYQTSIRLIGSGKNWKIMWSASTLHPQLRAGNRIVFRSVPIVRGSILDGSDEPLIKNRAVVVVGIEPRRVTNQARLIAALKAAFAKVKVQVALDDLPKQLAAAKPDAFVEVVTLRREAYDQIRNDIRDLPGTVFQEQQLPLAPTRAFARALLGTVGPVRKDQLDASKGFYQVGDPAGQGGLQELYDAQLRGSKGFRLVIVRAADNQDEADNPEEVEVFKADPIAGAPLKTTLNQKVQNAADRALSGQTLRSALVAIRISDGAVLAVANGPDGGELNLAFTASVPPGSTFKMVSALSLLDSGAVTADSIVACPKTYSVEGRVFRNAGDFQLGSVPFHTDFAKSCNTAFASLASRLGPTGLDTTAKSLGIGTAWRLGTEVYPGSVQVNPSAVDSAAAAFGQGQTQVSPVVLAAAAAAVARGSWTMPTLLRTMPASAPPAVAGIPAPPANGAALKADSVAALRSMMREVVTAGTATALADVPGGPVFAKTGTAEYDNNPAHTHAWTIGWQGDVAFAVFVEKGGSSSATAVPIVEAFLRAL